MNELIADGLQRALADHCTADEIRKLESGGPALLWDVVEPLGYLDAFVAEKYDGIGLKLADAFDLGFVLGRSGYPLPMFETALARSLIANAGVQIPEGIVVVCDAVPVGPDLISLPQTPGLRYANYVLARHLGNWYLLPIPQASLSQGDYRPAISGAAVNLSLETALARFSAPHSAMVLTAPLNAAEMAGSMTAVLDMTLTYANDRSQFGRPIGKFQALQMEISLLAELVAFATMAARMGCTGLVTEPNGLRGVNAKLACCDAAERSVAIAHSVHGAIGITEEYALGLHARRLHEWRATGLVASSAARQVGQALLETDVDTLEFIRTRLSFA